MSALALGGIQVIVSPLLPMHPDHKADARRIVRHGMRDVVEWLGEDVGPKPGEPTDFFLFDNSVLHVSADRFEALRRNASVVGVFGSAS